MSNIDYNGIKLRINNLLDEVIKLREEYEKESDPVKRMSIVAEIYNKRVEIDKLLNSFIP